MASNHSYGTINSDRAALSLISDELGKDSRVTRFLRGVYRTRPPKPKYEVTWDPQLVLSYLEKQMPNEDLSLKAISLKLVMVLSLITAHRLQTMSLIKISNINLCADGFQIFITDLIKTSGPRRNQPCLQVPYFPGRPGLCAASILKIYLQKTKDFRGNEDSLFLTFKAPHGAASKDTLSRWIKETLKASGVDTTRFTPHSTRHSATSAAFRRGIPVETIRKAAGWSATSLTFAKFYNRPLGQEKAQSFASSLIAQNIPD